MLIFSLVEKAYASTLPTTVTNLIEKILDKIVNPIITLGVAVAIVYFMWGVLKFIRNADNSEERKNGGKHIMYGAIGLAIMASAYGILNLILDTILVK